MTMIEGEKTGEDKLHYSPPKSDLKSVSIACTILTLFFSCWYHALFQINVFTSPWWDILGTFILLEFLYTGVFITSHDAMHGAVAPRHRRLNNAIGHLCLSIYAWFDYRLMYEKHWEHHKHTGVVDKDPDFHNGQAIDFVSWYYHFMQEYISLQQITKMTIWVTILLLGCSVPLPNVLLYMLTCGLSSSFRLFYFGTYLPHRPPVIDGKFELHMPWEKSYSANVNRLISFLCCYHFDYHWEHHRWPYAPWFDLWKCKELRGKIQ